MPAIRVGIIGAGLMGRHHAAAARACGAKVVAVVDARQAVADHLAGQFGDARASMSAAGLACDVAHVCTPLDTHAAIAFELAAAGIDALIEKPIGADHAEAAAIATAFSDAGRFVCPVHQYAFHEGMDRAVAALPSIGRLVRIDFEIASAGALGDNARADAVAIEILPHPLAILQRLLPDVRLAGLAWQVTRPQPGEWQIGVVIDAVIVSIAISMARRPTQLTTRISGDAGTIEIDHFHGYAVRHGGRATRATKIARPFAHSVRHFGAAGANLMARGLRGEAAYPGLRALTRQFYRAVAARDAALLPIGTQAFLDVAQACDAIAAQGQCR